MSVLEVPAFVQGSFLVESAFWMAQDAHREPGPNGAKSLSHPVAVAQLLSQQGFDETVIAAALLHDTVEYTPLTTSEIRARFGTEVAALVAEVTEDAQIEPYVIRKAEARSRVMRDRPAAAIYAADKLANVRELLASDRRVEGERLDHYIKTLRLLFDGRPELPFLGELSEELAQLVDRELGRQPIAV